MAPMMRNYFMCFLFGFACASFIFFFQPTYVKDHAPYGIIKEVTKESLAFINYSAAAKMESKKSEDAPAISIENQKSRENDSYYQYRINEKMFQHRHGDSEVSHALKESVRVLCWIMTMPKNVDTRAIHVNATWAPRCNKYVFITTTPKSGLPTVDLHIPDGRNNLWTKTKAAFQWIYENEIDNYDWFMKADDDTYLIVENLRFMLLAYSPNDPLYFGCRFKPFAPQGYMSGGAGYVLSREAVKRFVTEGIPDPNKCKVAGDGSEDVEIGKCLEKVNVIAGDSRDSKGRHRMLPLSPLLHLQTNTGLGHMPKWFLNYMYYPYEQGKECCSDYMISFHYVNKETMYALDNLLYHIKPFGASDDYWMSESKNLSKNGTKSIDILKILAVKNSMPVKAIHPKK